MQLVSLTCYPT